MFRPVWEAVVLTALRRQPQRRYQPALGLLDDLDHLDQLDPANYDISPEPAMPGAIGGAEGPALARLVLLSAGGFLTIVAFIIVISVALR
jgi:hypothetical protein